MVKITEMLITVLKINLLCYLLFFSAHFRSLFIPVTPHRTIRKSYNVKFCVTNYELANNVARQRH